MGKRIENLTITEFKWLNYNTFVLALKSQTKLPDILPGQFVNVRVKGSETTFLRRPFSVHDVDFNNNTIIILIKVVGDGTRSISISKIGEELDVVFPLGNSFSFSNSLSKILLIGGGVGIAPMLFLAKEAKKMGIDVHIILGAKSASDHILLDDFKEFGNVYVTTDDGSLGEKGFVTNHPVFSKESSFDYIYCCGPELMMVAVAKLAKAIQVPCEVSLENMMACGFGVCLCCVTPTPEGNKCVCTEGPVFNTKDLSWQI
jgi:dihydroorotate dehydrogenase electron transfer subunit